MTPELFAIVAPIGAILALIGFAFGRWRGRAAAQRIGLGLALAGVAALVVWRVGVEVRVEQLFSYLPPVGMGLIALAAGCACAIRIKSLVTGALVAAAIPILFVWFVTSI